MMTEELSSKENQLNTSRMKVVGIRTRSSAKSVIHSVGSISIRVGEKVKILKS